MAAASASGMSAAHYVPGSCNVFGFRLPFNATISLPFSHFCRHLDPSKNRPVFTGSSRFAEVLVTDPEDGNSQAIPPSPPPPCRPKCNACTRRLQMTSNHIHFAIRPPPPIESPSLCSPPPPFAPAALPPPTPCTHNINLSACTLPSSPPPPSFCACLNLTPRSSPAFLVDTFTFSHLLETDLLRVKLIISNTPPINLLSLISVQVRVRELRDVVDRFVLLEAGRTFQVRARAAYAALEGECSPADAGCRGKSGRFYSMRLPHLSLICWVKIASEILPAAAALMPFKSHRFLHQTSCRLRQRHISGMRQISAVMILNLLLANVYSNYPRFTTSQLGPHSHFAHTRILPTIALCRDSVFLSGALDGLPNGDVIVIIR
jgi:hypothetical protein